MIVCKRCGNHNDSADEFCGSCGVFLEWEGERIDEPMPAFEPPVAPPSEGLVTRIKNAIVGDPTLPPPGGFPAPSQSRGGSAGAAMAPPATVAGSSHPPPRAPTAADAAAGALSAKLPTPVMPAPRQPTAQTPAAEVARPKPQVKAPPTRTINPGDLVCGTCGEGNTPDRHFCRRCGTTLAEVVPVRRRWYQRKPSAADAATAGASGTASARSGMSSGAAGGGASAAAAGAGTGKTAKRKARRVKGGVFAGFTSVRRVIAILAIVGIGTGLAVPGLRATITNKGSDILNSIKRKVDPSFTQVGPDDTLTTASSETAGRTAAQAADGASNTIWLADPADTDPTVTLHFSPPTSLDKILITPGDQEQKADFKAQPRPKDVFVSALAADGTVIATKQLSVADKADPQKFDISAKNVVSVTVAVQSCYPDPALRVCAITELEFFKKK